MRATRFHLVRLQAKIAILVMRFLSDINALFVAAFFGGSQFFRKLHEDSKVRYHTHNTLLQPTRAPVSAFYL
ncbi:hypothetical protein [Thiocystis violascens]|uniref:Uncharacterized protein n=1 Tax=Thiocystis violascens (strain ATCC 17096 / DSM 198 / 6111) TaxID=765911 RepID=I3Y8E2_THIV6|nr:hypothetical protein [Thiocystis violascens]AFL73260.1 hypothetical protein Thivi_1237 [Thiocystis violascens DSM 198]